MLLKNSQTISLMLILLIINTSHLLSQEKIKITFGENEEFYNKLEDLTNYKPEIIPEFFLLGTLTDYMGRFHDTDREGQIDYYHKNEKPLVDYLVKYIKEKMNIQVDSAYNYTVLNSDKLAKILNSFYSKHDDLNVEKFKADKEVYSYLLGRYLRTGTKITDKIYKIQLENAFNGDLLYSLLKEIHCSKIFFNNYLLEGYGTQYESFYFEANPKLVLYMNTLEEERSKNYQYYLNHHFDTNELREEQLKADLEEVVKIKALFE